MAAEHSPYFSVHTQVLVLQLTAGYSTKNRDDAESHSYTQVHLGILFDHSFKHVILGKFSIGFTGGCVVRVMQNLGRHAFGQQYEGHFSSARPALRAGKGQPRSKNQPTIK